MKDPSRFIFYIPFHSQLPVDMLQKWKDNLKKWEQVGKYGHYIVIQPRGVTHVTGTTVVVRDIPRGDGSWWQEKEEEKEGSGDDCTMIGSMILSIEIDTLGKTSELYESVSQS